MKVKRYRNRFVISYAAGDPVVRILVMLKMGKMDYRNDKTLRTTQEKKIR